MDTKSGTSASIGPRRRITGPISPLEIDRELMPYYPSRQFASRDTSRANRRVFIRAGIIITASLLVVVTWSFISHAVERWYWNRAKTKWTWDHNMYPPQVNSVDKVGDDKNISRNLLILQQATSVNVAKVVDVTSRVNRGYARQWGVDYVRLDGSVDSARVLQILLRKKASAARVASYSAIVADEAKKEYAVVLMLDADAVLVDMDYNILDMFSPGFLIGIIGGERISDVSIPDLHHGSGIIFWNLNHAEIGPVSKLWMDETQASLERDLNVDESSILVDVLNNIYGPRELRTLVQTLPPPLVDYFQGIAVKFFRKPSDIAQKMSWLNTNWEDIAIALQQTADAVCFKFYPKCELV